MHSVKIHGLHTGYVAWHPEPTCGELVYVGEEWALPEYQVYTHTHPQYEFHLQLSGATAWTVGEEVVEVGRSALIGVAPGHPHSFVALERHSHHFIYCAFIPELLFARIGREVPWPKAPYFLIEDAEAFAAPFAQLSHEVVHQQNFRAEMIEGAFRSIAHLLARYHEPGAPRSREMHTSFVTDVALQITHYIDSHLPERLSIDALAKAVGVSRSHLFEVMKREIGSTPAAYQLQRRVERAMEMLKMDAISLTSIAHDLGFGSSQHFSATFRKLVGKTPSEFRQLHTQPTPRTRPDGEGIRRRKSG